MYKWLGHNKNIININSPTKVVELLQSLKYNKYQFSDQGRRIVTIPKIHKTHPMLDPQGSSPYNKYIFIIPPMLDPPRGRRFYNNYIFIIPPMLDPPRGRRDLKNYIFIIPLKTIFL
jgi:hypothetical protein